MSDDDPEEYPHWRTALFGDQEHAANVYCAIKYGLWHLFHLLFVVMATVCLAVVIPLALAWRAVRYAAIVAGRWLSRNTPTTRVASTATRATAVTASTKEKPVTRRIYGYCPVSIKTDPKWFLGLTELGERVWEFVTPAETVWICDDCGWELSWEPDVEHGYCDGEFQEVAVGSETYDELNHDDGGDD